MVSTTRSRPEGTIRRRGDAWQASLFTGYDPLTGKRVYLTATVPAEAAEAAARKALNRFRSQRDEERAPRSRVDLSYALGGWLAVQELEASTRSAYETNVRTHIGPALGTLPISKLTPQILERFYAELRRCRARCQPRRMRASRWRTRRSPSRTS